MRPRHVRASLLVVLLPVALGMGYGGVVAGFWWSSPAEDCRATVLMFHDVVSDTARAARYRMRESEFARQMGEIRRKGLSNRPVGEFLEAVRAPAGSCPFLPDEVVLTFDMDGPSRHLEFAMPHLMRNGLDALFFVPTASIDRGGPRSADIRTLAAAGFSLGSHSEHHRDMRGEPTDSMIESLVRTREILHELTGQRIRALAAPGGRYDDRVIDTVVAADFDFFFNSDPCFISRGSSPFRICRVEIRGDRGPSAAEAARSERTVAVQAGHWWLKQRFERVVGPSAYQRLSGLRTRIQGPGS